MEMPAALRAGVEELASAHDPRRLAECVRALTRRYAEESGAGRRLLTRDEEAAAYCAARMPATFAAVDAALGWACARMADFNPLSLLDVGAGTGAAGWAVEARFRPERITCLEREPAMRAAGQRLASAGGGAMRDARWLDFDLNAPDPLPPADLVTAAYVLNEMSEEGRLSAALRLWDAARGMLLIVEPGTPVASAQLMRVRGALLARGARVAAPCPGDGPCPMDGGDWCHFQTRVARSRLHKRLKGGDAPYEDEKFSYLALTREQPTAESAPRILRVPRVDKGRVALTLCDGCGIGERVVTRKSEAFKRARKAVCGDAFEER